MALPPNCSLDVISAIARECEIPQENFCLNGRRRFGFLGTSDLVVNLRGAAREGALQSGDWIAAFGIAPG
jgi:3-oxoacyl-[acyl-carrier-protein] synthase III